MASGCGCQKCLDYEHAKRENVPGCLSVLFTLVLLAVISTMINLTIARIRWLEAQVPTPSPYSEEAIIKDIQAEWTKLKERI